MIPEAATPLETALHAAAQDPARRPAFYELLLDATVYVIGHTAAPGQGAATLQAGEKLAIQHWQTKDGKAVVPFFTNLAALRRVLKEQMGFLALPARELFTLTRGASLVLDPMSEHSKEFYPDEVAALLDGGVAHLGRMHEVADAREIQLDQPADYPHALVAALARFLPRHPAVRRAFLCRMTDAASGDAPSLLVGFDGDGDLDDAIREAGSVAVDTAPQDMAVGFTAVQAGSPGPGEYMLGSVAPFYTRAPAPLSSSSPSAAGSPGLAATIRRWFGRR